MSGPTVMASTLEAASRTDAVSPVATIAAGELRITYTQLHMDEALWAASTVRAAADDSLSGASGADRIPVITYDASNAGAASGTITVR